MSFNPKNYFLKRLTNFEKKSRLSFYNFTQRQTTIGRHLHSNFLLNGARTSKDHAIIEFRGGKMFLKDLGTKIGTYVNGIKYKNEEIELTENMIIGFGYNHYLPEHMNDEKSAIYQVFRPEVIDLDSDYESDDVVFIGQEENKKIQESNKNQGNLEMSEDEPNVSDLDDEESEKNQNSVKSLQNNQISSNTKEIIQESIISSHSDETLKRLETGLNELENSYTQFKNSHINLTKNIEQLPKIIDDFDKNYKEISNSPKMPPRRLSILIPPNVNHNLLKNVQNLQLSKTSSILKNIDKNSPISSQNCENLVELAKNLQGGKGIKTVTEAAVKEVQNNIIVQEQNEKISEETMEIDNELITGARESLMTTENVNNQNFYRNIENSQKSLTTVENSQNNKQTSEQSTKTTFTAGFTNRFRTKFKSIYGSVDSPQNDAEKTPEKSENNLIPISKSTTSKRIFSFPSFNDKSTNSNEDQNKPSNSPIPFPQNQRTSNNEIVGSQESLLEEIKIKKFPIRRESICKMPRKRGRPKSSWSTNPGMVQKVSRPAKKIKLGETMPGNENLIAIPTVSPPKDLSKENTDKPSTSETPTGPKPRPPIQRRKSIFQQQSELISDKDTIVEKEKKIRHWTQNKIQFLDELPSIPTSKSLLKGRGRKSKFQ